MGVLLTLLENTTGMTSKSSCLQFPTSDEAVTMRLGVFRFYPSSQNMLSSLCKVFLFLCLFKNLPHYWIEAQEKEDSIGSVNSGEQL